MPTKFRIEPTEHQANISNDLFLQNGFNKFLVGENGFVLSIYKYNNEIHYWELLH